MPKIMSTKFHKVCYSCIKDLKVGQKLIHEKRNEDFGEK